MTENSNKNFTEWHESMIKENHRRSTDNEKDIEVLEKADIVFKAELQRLCENVNALTKVLWALAGAILITLVAEVVKSFI